MAELLRGGGYRPLTAAGGEEAFEIARLERPSVVITDVLMSGVNGFELTRRLRGEPELADTPILFWTAHYDDREVREMAAALDIAGVLPKPCDLKGVLEMVGDAVAGATPSAPREPAGDFDRDHARLLSDKLVEMAGALDRAHVDLRESDERFRMLVSNIPGAVYRRALDADLTVEFVSAEIEEITGYPPASLTENHQQSFAEPRPPRRSRPDRRGDARRGAGRAALRARLSHRPRGRRGGVGGRPRAGGRRRRRQRRLALRHPVGHHRAQAARGRPRADGAGAAHGAEARGGRSAGGGHRARDQHADPVRRRHRALPSRLLRRPPAAAGRLPRGVCHGDRGPRRRDAARPPGAGGRRGRPRLPAGAPARRLRAHAGRRRARRVDRARDEGVRAPAGRAGARRPQPGAQDHAHRRAQRVPVRRRGRDRVRRAAARSCAT